MTTAKVTQTFSDGSVEAHEIDFTPPSADDAITAQEKSAAAGEDIKAQRAITMDYCRKYLHTVDGVEVSVEDIPPGIMTLIGLSIQEHAAMGKGWRPGS